MTDFRWVATTGQTWNTVLLGSGSSVKWEYKPVATWINAVAVPSAADDVYFDGTGNGNCTMGSASYPCRSIDFTGYTGTLNHSVGTLNVGDGVSAGSINALKLVSGMTYTKGGTFNLIATHGTLQTITTASKTIQTLNINGAGSNYVLGDPLSLTNVFTISAGAFSTGSNRAMTLNGGFNSSNTGVRTINLNASTVTIAAGYGWDVSTITNLTATFSGATINIPCVGGGTITFAGGGQSYGTLNITSFGTFSTPAIMVITGSNTFGTLSSPFSDTSGRTADLVFADGTTTTITSSITLTGNSTTRMTVRSQTGGTQFTLTKGVTNVAGGRTVLADWIALIDSKATGEAKWFASNSTNNGNNVNWRFNAINRGAQTMLGCGI